MKRVIVSGGGTGGHIYPAVAVAEALRRRFGEEVEILFVGAEGKMEMEKVPALGYRIVGLPVAGLQRRFDLKTWRCPSRCLKASARPGAPSATSGPMWSSVSEGMPAARCCGRRSGWGFRP